MEHLDGIFVGMGLAELLAVDGDEGVCREDDLTGLGLVVEGAHGLALREVANHLLARGLFVEVLIEILVKVIVRAVGKRLERRLLIDVLRPHDGVEAHLRQELDAPGGTACENEAVYATGKVKQRQSAHLPFD